jgi:hypothetical protein
MLRNLLKGALAGTAATTAMSAVMLAGQRAGLMRDQPPRRIVRGLLPGHRRRVKPGEKPLALLTHYAFGSAFGALLAVLSRGRGVSVPIGAGYGLAIWLASYEGWVPSVAAIPPAHRDSRGRVAVMTAGHLVYGGVLARALRPVSRPADG